MPCLRFLGVLPQPPAAVGLQFAPPLWDRHQAHRDRYRAGSGVQGPGGSGPPFPPEGAPPACCTASVAAARPRALRSCALSPALSRSSSCSPGLLIAPVLAGVLFAFPFLSDCLHSHPHSISDPALLTPFWRIALSSMLKPTPSSSLQLRTLSLLSLSFVYPCLSFILSVSTGLQEPCVSSGAGLRDQEAVGEQLGETELV